MSMNTSVNQNLDAVSAPVIRSIVQSGTVLVPETDISVILGSDVTITINGKSLSLFKNMTFILVKGVVYEFSDDITLGVS